MMVRPGRGDKRGRTVRNRENKREREKEREKERKKRIKLRNISIFLSLSLFVFPTERKEVIKQGYQAHLPKP